MKKFREIVLTGIISSIFLSFQIQKDKMENNQMHVNGTLKLFLCGDVMTARGIDQALPRSVNPVLYEGYVKDARDYLLLAERENGNIDTPVPYEYIWGDALKIWEKIHPDLKLINLETSITTNDEPWPGKGIHYRMHPQNVELFTAAGIDYCSLANNHVLDWGRTGLIETIQTLDASGIKHSGAGINQSEAGKPAVFNTRNGRALVFSYGSPTSGIPQTWAATENKSGVNPLPDFGESEIRKIKQAVTASAKNSDVVILSVHWGGNWGYAVGDKQKEFAHALIDEAGADIIFGHSSHHPMGMEVYNEKLIIYGAGDFINDYEGISGHEEYRGELSLMYFPKIDATTGNLQSLQMIPMKIKKFQLNFAPEEDADWLQKILDRESEKFGTNVRIDQNNVLWLEW